MKIYTQTHKSYLHRFYSKGMENATHFLIPPKTQYKRARSRSCWSKSPSFWHHQHAPLEFPYPHHCFSYPFPFLRSLGNTPTTATTPKLVPLEVLGVYIHNAIFPMKLNETFSHLVYVCVNLICTDKKISQACKRASFPDFDALEAQQSNPPIKVKWSIDTFPYMKKCLKPVHKEKKIKYPKEGRVY